METNEGGPGSDESWVIGSPDAEHLDHVDRSPEPPPSHHGPRWRKLLVAPVVVGLLLLIFGLATFGILYARTRVPAAPPLAEATELLDRDGRPLATLAGEEDREIIPFRKIPEHLRDAVIATEDAEFYDHPGVDVTSTARAAIANLRSGEFTQGGSTITQQLVKNLYTGADKTIERKVNEAVLALKLERELTKDEILAKYLNTVYFGHGAYGVQAAAQTYFDVPARELDVVQSAMLAGLLAAPSRWDPIAYPGPAVRRRRFVLQRMADEGYVSRAQARTLSKAELALAKREASWTEDGSAYFIDDAKRWLEDRFGSEQTFAGGLDVTTTLDTEWQNAAEDAVDELPAHGPQAALVAIDPATGAIRAMVGGRDFQRSQFNLATQARRQPGSAAKLFGLVAALESGISPLERFAGPPRIRIPKPPCGAPGEPWIVENYADASAGTTDLFGATANSVNTIYAQIVEEVGPEAVAAAASQLGVRSELEAVCPIVLGSEEVTPLELTSAFATVAAGGVYHEPSPVEEVLDRRGTRIAAIARAGEPALDPTIAAIVTEALQGVVTSGTGTAAALPDRPVAGKTGTAQEYTNAWFCGYVPQLAACVWMGYPDGNRPMDGVTGGSTPAEIWRAFMSAATAGMEVEDFPAVDLSPYRASPSPAPTPTRVITPSNGPQATMTAGAPPATATSSPSSGAGATPSPSPTRSGGPKGSPTPTPTPKGSPGGDAP
jgi:penicillin-binding protein 1A